MSITKTQAQIDADAAHAALVAADNAIFIANTDQQIQDAIALGHFQISTTTFGNVDVKQIFDYYANLGYFIYYPDYPLSQNYQPAMLFGEYWIAFWNHTLVNHCGKNPLRLIVGWQP